MNEWTNERMNEWTKWMTEWTNDRMNEWSNDRLSEWTKKQIIEWTVFLVSMGESNRKYKMINKKNDQTTKTEIHN